MIRTFVAIVLALSLMGSAPAMATDVLEDGDEPLCAIEGREPWCPEIVVMGGCYGSGNDRESLLTALAITKEAFRYLSSGYLEIRWGSTCSPGRGEWVVRVGVPSSTCRSGKCAGY